MATNGYLEPTKFSSHNNKQLQYILDLLKKGDDELELRANKDIVLVLGNTGSGKSTLTQYVVGNSNHLWSRRNAGDIIIIDDNDKISVNSTINSKTIFPDLVYDTKTDTYYYDCPGFSDTRSAAHDISATFFVKKIIDFSKSVKLVFTINHSSVRSGNHRDDFMNLVKHIVDFINDINKFRNSIALVVTKVDTLGRIENNRWVIAEDKDIVAGIANFFESVKHDLTEGRSITNRRYSHDFYDKAIRFIDLLLIKVNDDYQRIGIFRRPLSEGVLSKSELMKSGKQRLDKMIHENIQFTKVENKDFGYTVSADSRVYVYELVEEINNSITKELAEIENRIVEYLKNEEELYSLQLIKAHEMFNESYEKFFEIQKKAISDTISSLQFMEEVVKIINILKINIPLKHLSSILSLESYLNFLHLVSNRSQPKNRSSHLAKGLSSVIQYLYESDRWYTFLYNLFTSLSEYRIQRDISKYNISSLEQSIVRLNDSQFRLITLDPIFEQIINDSKVLVNNEIKNILLNKPKMNALNKVLNFTLGHKCENICTKNELTIIGQYLKLSDLEKLLTKCTPFPKENMSIELLAFNKVFIDTSLDYTGRNSNLKIISPIWEIVADSDILLDGMPGGKHYSRSENTDFEGKGIGGRSGLTGGSAGTFFGIGSTFINEQNLRISAVGGVGGDGEAGGNGKDGDNGRKPDIPNAFFIADELENWDAKGWTHQEDYTEINYRPDGSALGEFYPVVFFTVHGTNGSTGGDGGDGGVGGVGGKGGQIVIIKTDDKPTNFEIISSKGKRGNVGQGGKEGKGGSNSQSVKIICDLKTSYEINKQGNCNVIKRQDYGGKAKNGKRGRDGIDAAENENSSEIIQIENCSQTINKFKNYSRKYLNNSLKVTMLRNFYNNLENNASVINYYNVLGFIDELKGLENQYFQFQNEIDFLPFYQSLLRRISNYTERKKSLQYRAVLLQLYAATLSKISSINTNFESKLVVDIKAYLDLAKTNIKNLEESYHQVKINELYNNYNESFQNKINEANQFIEADIGTDIKHIYKEIFNSIETILIRETKALENTSRIEKRKLMKKQNDLEHLITTKKILEAVSIASYFLMALGGIGTLTGAIAEAGVSYTNTLLSEDNSKVEQTQIPDGVGNTLKEMSEMLNDKNQLLYNQLDVIAEELKEFVNKYSFTKVSTPESLIEAKEILEQIKANVIEENTEEMDKLKEKINNILEEFEKKNKSFLVEHKMTKSLNRIKNSLMIAPDVYNAVKDNEGMIELLGAAEIQAGIKIKEMQQYHRAINTIIVPKFRDLKSKIDSMNKEMKGKSRFSIEMSKWKIQSSINEVYKNIYKMTSGFRAGEKLMRCIEKLQEGMTTMIALYDLLEHYHDETQLFEYLKLIGSTRGSKVSTTDAEVNTSIDELDLIIQSNLVLGQYEKAVSTFKQYVFPFAHSYLSDFSLPPTLHLENNTTILTHHTLKNLENLRAKIAETNLSIGNYDKYIHSNIIYSSENGQSPFFVWSHKTTNDTISKLLEGKEIFLDADITESSNRNAIKFNIIGLKLKSSFEKIQEELDRELENFEVTMVHFGNSNYRCGNKIYTIRSDKQTISFYLKKNLYGEPINNNQVYDKIKKNDFMLSPYTMWSIKLKNISSVFSKLEKFKDEEVSLELEGRGQYVDEDINKHVCNDNLKNYYTVNKVLSDIDSVEELKLKLSLGGRTGDNINVKSSSSNKRERRQVKRKNVEPIATSGSVSSENFSLFNNVLKVAVRGLRALKYLNPISNINSLLHHSEGIEQHYQSILQICGRQEVSDNFSLPEISNRNKEFKQQALISEEQYSLFSLQSNLLLWDLIYKKVMGGNKKRQSSNCKLDRNDARNNSAQSLAYRYYFNSVNADSSCPLTRSYK